LSQHLQVLTGAAMNLITGPYLELTKDFGELHF